MVRQGRWKVWGGGGGGGVEGGGGGGGPFPGWPKTLGPYQGFSAGASFGAPVFDLTLWRRYQAARATVSASKANSLSTREQVILLVVSQYIGTLRAVSSV